MKDKQIVFTKINTAQLLDVEPIKVEDNTIKVKTYFSSISCGTEKANIMGDVNINIADAPTKEPVFPRKTGYSSSGVVVETGKNVKDFKVGDRVVMSWSVHKNHNYMIEDNLVKIEDENISFKEAALCHIGTFPMAAVRKLKIEMGESAMVMGLGILGLFAVMFARCQGAYPVIAVDPVAKRREKALSMGADFAFDPFDKDFVKKVKEVCKGGVNAAVEVTGIGDGLNQCLDCMARFGRIALLGCTRDKNFTVDYYRKVHGPGISIIGAHTLARPSFESHHGYFTQKDDIKAILKLISGKRINLKDVVDKVYSPKDCEKVYKELVSNKGFPSIVQFDWTLE